MFLMNFYTKKWLRDYNHVWLQILCILVYICVYVRACVCVYAGCFRRNLPYFGRMFLKLHRYNQTHLYVKLSSYGDNDEIIFKE
jgi:hypothetical protein